jgi:hypothetical protein
MLSKDEILTYAQQGQAPAGWLVLHPRSSYLVRQALIYAVLAAVVVILGVIFISQNSYVITPGFGTGSVDPGTFQTWRYIDEGVLAAVFLVPAIAAIRHVIDLSNLHNHVLVLMPDGFLLKKGNTEQLVGYTGVQNISYRYDRYGNVTLNITASGTRSAYRVRLDNRYGNGRSLASQIVSMHRQFMTSAQARPVQ